MISVIIPTRNRAEFLASALGSLLDQALSADQFEILVIDNGSSDHTAAVVKDQNGTHDNLRYFHEPEPGLHAGRHRGLAEANSDTLVFADDDIEALPTWLAAVDEAFADSSVAMVGGNNFPMFMGAPPDWLTALWNRPTDLGGRALPALSILDLPGPPRSISPYLIWGCNFAIRREVLLRAGGFHPDGMPEELIRFRGDGETYVSRFVVESGMKCLFHPGASVYHKVAPERMTYGYFRQRGYNQGVSDSYTVLRSGGTHARSQRSLPYRCARWGWNQIRSAAARIQTPAATRTALENFNAGHREGYAFHQDAYRADPEVREWVHRERYF